MQKALLAVDRFSTFIGKTFAWTAVGLTLENATPAASTSPNPP